MQALVFRNPPTDPCCAFALSVVRLVDFARAQERRQMRYDRLFNLSADVALALGLAVLIGGVFGGWLGWIGETTAGALAKGSFAFIIPGGFIKLLEWTEESPEEQRTTEAAFAELKKKWLNQDNES